MYKHVRQFPKVRIRSQQYCDCDVKMIQAWYTCLRDTSADFGVDGVGTAVVVGDHVGVYKVAVFIRVDLRHTYMSCKH